MTTKHQVTLPDGRVAKRTSKSRKYSHAVAYQIPAAVRVAHLRKDAADSLAKAAEYRSGWSKRYNEDLNARWGVEKVTEWAENAEANAERRTAEADQIEAAQEASEWCVAGWCGRIDLAQKLAAQYVGHGYTVRILDAETV